MNEVIENELVLYYLTLLYYVQFFNLLQLIVDI